MKKQELSLKGLNNMIEKVFKESPSPMIYHTGREGAIQYTIQLEIEIAKLATGKDKLIDIDKSTIESKVRSQIIEHGTYKICSNTGLTYLGLWNENQKDGQFLIKRDNRWYIEDWFKGFRQQYKIISQKEADEIIDKLKKK